MCLSHLIYTVRPCLIDTCHAMPIPRPCHAPTLPFFSRPRHSMVVERRPVGSLPAFGFFRLPRVVPRRLLSESCQSSQRSVPTTVMSGSSIKKKDLLNCWTSSSDISCYHVDFYEGHGTVVAGRGAAWHVWINGTAWQGNGMGAARTRRAMCESVLKVTDHWAPYLDHLS